MFSFFASTKLLLVLLIYNTHQEFPGYTSAFETVINEGLTGQYPTVDELFGTQVCIEEPENDFFTYYVPQESESETTEIVEEKRNYRDELNTLVHYYHLDHAYKVESEDGPSHQKSFQVSLTLGDEIYYGTGRSKKEAKEMAAKEAIENSNYKQPVKKVKDKTAYDEKSPPTVVLNNLGAKHGYDIDYFLYDPMASKRIINLKTFKNPQISNISFWKEVAHLDQPPKSPFHVEVIVEQTSFYGKGHTIQDAKHNSAIKAIETLKEQGLDKSSVCTRRGSEIECKEAKEKLKSPISKVHEYSQTERLDVEFNEIDKTGPPHKPIFTYECKLGSMSVKAEGKSKKEAKKHAAEKMLENLPLMESMNANSQDETSEKKKKKRAKNYLNLAKDTLKNAMSLFSTNNGDEEKQETNQDNEDSKKPKKGKKSKYEDRWSPKEKLLKVGKSLDLKIQFRSIKRDRTGFMSLLSLNLNPKYICYGVGANREIAHEYASLNALKFLYKMDLLENVDVKDLEIERFNFDNYIWLAEDYSPKK